MPTSTARRPWPKNCSGKRSNVCKLFALLLGSAHRFKAPIQVVDTTTIRLIASCLDWAKHRRRKAAAKCHLRLDLHSLLPRFVLVDPARDHDAKRAREVCAALRQCEIVIFDKAYVDFAYLQDLTGRRVW